MSNLKSKFTLENGLIAFGAVGAFLILRSYLQQRDDADRAEIIRQGNLLPKLNVPFPPAPIPVPVPPPQPAPQPQPAPARPTLINGPLQAIPGRVYHATVDISAPASWAASTESVHSQATKAGFTNVTVDEGRKPAGWPGTRSGDYYVSAVYSGAPKTMDRSYLGGQVKIVEVWEG